MVAHGPDLGPGRDAQPPAAVRARGAAVTLDAARATPGAAPVHDPGDGEGDAVRGDAERRAVAPVARGVPHPPPRLTRLTATPELAHLHLRGARVLFRATPPRLHYWLRWIDRWIAYAKSVVAE